MAGVKTREETRGGFDITGFPLDLARKVLEKKGFRIEKANGVAPPKDFKSKKRKEYDETARFVVSWGFSGGKNVAVRVVECGDFAGKSK